MSIKIGWLFKKELSSLLGVRSGRFEKSDPDQAKQVRMRNTDSHPARKKLELSAGEPEQKINFLPRHGFTLLTVHQPPATRSLQ